jgi:hypothetical protein
MLSDRKAASEGINLMFKILAGLLVLGVIVILILYVKGIIGGATEGVGTCGGVIVGTCDYVFDYQCPPDAKAAVLSDGCPGNQRPEFVPANKDTNKALIDAKNIAAQAYKKEVAEYEKQMKDQGIRLTVSDKEKLKYDYFGRCCEGVSAPETTK